MTDLNKRALDLAKGMVSERVRKTLRDLVAENERLTKLVTAGMEQRESIIDKLEADCARLTGALEQIEQKAAGAPNAGVWASGVARQALAAARDGGGS